MISTAIKNESRTPTETGRGCEQAQKASRLKYVLLAMQAIGNAMKHVFSNNRPVKINERRVALRDGNSAAVQASASKWLRVAVNHWIVKKTLDYLMGVVIGSTLDYLLGVLGRQQELRGFQGYCPFLRAVVLLAVETLVARGLVLLREHASSRLSILTLVHRHRPGARLDEVRRRTAVNKDQK
jgi:hypothetical protein